MQTSSLEYYHLKFMYCKVELEQTELEQVLLAAKLFALENFIRSSKMLGIRCATNKAWHCLFF